MSNDSPDPQVRDKRPIVFSNDKAFNYLEENGEVYTFRTSEKRPNGPVWVRRSRTGEKEFDATLWRCGHINNLPEDLNYEEWAEKSGFGDVESWAEAIIDIHGELPDEGYVFCISKKGDEQESANPGVSNCELGDLPVAAISVSSDAFQTRSFNYPDMKDSVESLEPYEYKELVRRGDAEEAIKDREEQVRQRILDKAENLLEDKEFKHKLDWDNLQWNGAKKLIEELRDELEDSESDQSADSSSDLQNGDDQDDEVDA